MEVTMLSKLTRGNQLTIPSKIAKLAGLKAGRDYLDVEYVKGTILLKPVDIEERTPDESYEKLCKKALELEKEDIELNKDRAENFLYKRLKNKK